MAVRASGDGTVVDIWLQPRASKSRIVGSDDRGLKVTVCSPPVEGRANEELIGLFSEILSVPKARLSIQSGAKGRRKALLIRGMKPEQVEDIIKASTEGSSD
ncbi:MAG: DUF167 domain-containing protein [Candidatus Aquicultorales bacterium]